MEWKGRDIAFLSSFSALVTDLVCIFRQVAPWVSSIPFPSSLTGVGLRRVVTFAVCLTSLSHLSSLSVALCFPSEGYLSVCPSCVSVSSDLSSSHWTCTAPFSPLTVVPLLFSTHTPSHFSFNVSLLLCALSIPPPPSTNTQSLSLFLSSIHSLLTRECRLRSLRQSSLVRYLRRRRIRVRAKLSLLVAESRSQFDVRCR